MLALLVERSSYEAVSVSDAMPLPPHDNANPWRAECVRGHWFVRREDGWVCAMRVTPTKRGDDADRQRAETVADTLNRLSR